MKSLDFESGLANERKLLVVIFWINRKAARTEGCAPFLIEKIITSKNEHFHDGTQLLKISDDLMEELVADLEAGQTILFEFTIGNERINAKLSQNSFCVTAETSPEIEEEIIDKLEMELPKKVPSVCDSFTPRITPHK
ncbi:MAG TPA: hypothetical protein VK444_01415 [Methanobacteriaceae archaeon]|nr:hypothetical protein [Methanobacteriaceae archaeon]